MRILQKVILGCVGLACLAVATPTQAADLSHYRHHHRHHHHHHHHHGHHHR